MSGIESGPGAEGHYRVVYEAHLHQGQLPDHEGFGIGTIVQCTDCGSYWRRTSYSWYELGVFSRWHYRRKHQI